jgi:hypothetical protein
MLTKKFLSPILLVVSIMLAVIPAETKIQEATAAARAEAYSPSFDFNQPNAGLLKSAFGAPPVAQFFPDTPKQIDWKYIEKVNKKAEPIPTIKFTVEDFLKAPTVSTGSDGKPQITIHKYKRVKNVDSAEVVTVPLDQYVAELNQHEAFLNQLGVTLRDGKLNKQNPNDTQIQRDLGVLLRLRDRKEADQAWQPKVDAIWVDWNRLALYEPHSPKRRITERIISINNPRDLSTRLREINARDAVEQRAVLRNLAMVQYRTGMERLGGRVLTFYKESGTTDCEKKLSSGVALNPWCSKGDPPPCTNTPSGPTSSVNNETSSPCGEGPKQADDPACMYDGVITPKTFPALVTTFDSASGGKNWFGTYASFDLIAHLKQDGTPYVEISNVGKARAGLLILGSQIDLLNASNYTNYNTKMQQPDVQRTATALGQDITTTPVSKTIPGPGTTLVITPLPPIMISSEFKASVKLADDDKAQFQAVPTACQGGSGKVRMFLGPRMTASVEIVAKLEALVASAGIKGVLTLADDTFGESLTTEVLPASNRVNITPALEYKYKHLAGAIYLFLKLDMAFYTKEWSVEIIDFDGFHGDNTVSPKTYTFSAKKKS